MRRSAITQARTAAVLLAAVLLLGLPAAAGAGGGTAATARPGTTATGRPSPLVRATTTTTVNADAPVPVPASPVPPPGHRLSADQVIAIAERLPLVRSVRAKYPGSYGGAYLKGPGRWQVSYFSQGARKEIVQVIIDDRTGHVIEAWSGFQVAWTMARGYPGAFGRHVNALYIWIPLCVLFLVPFIDPRRPLRMLHLDLLVLLSFSVSLAFFDHAHIYASVPLVYPPLLYLLVRMLVLLRRPPPRRPEPPLRLLVPATWLAVAIVFLLGFRIALNVTDGNVIDVGYAGVIGADRIVHGGALYGGYPSDNEHGDTYGPFNYEAYVPFQQAFGWSGSWDDLPAAHAASVFFDLLACALLFLLGRRMRGPTLGIALSYAWVTYPFTLYALESDSNDVLPAALVLAALLACTYSGRASTTARGGLSALAGLSKFAPLALVPVLATHGLSEQPRRRRVLSLALFALGFIVCAALALWPALAHDTLRLIYDRTFAYQADRGAPFSIWGLYGGLKGPQTAVEAFAVVLALALAVVPRRPGIAGLAAACAAILIALQLSVEYWFYLYVPWFFPLVMLALLGRFSAQGRPSEAAASEPARSSLPAAAVSS